MKREFDSGEAKKLCASHKKLMDISRKTIASRDKDQDKLKKSATEVFKSKVIKSEIATALQSGNSNIQLQPSELALLRAAYVYDEGVKLKLSLESLEPIRGEITHDMNAVRSVNAPVKWLFSGKQAKEAANAAYQRLAEHLQDDYAKVIREKEEKADYLNDITVNEAYGAVSNYESQYFRCLMECVPDLVGKDTFSDMVSDRMRDVTEVVGQYQEANRKFKIREDHLKSDIEQTLNPIIFAKAMVELRKQDIEAISQRRSGIRVKLLKEHGYQTVADVFAATVHNLSSIHGISAETARNIKSAAQEIAADVSKTVKLKISSDDRTPDMTALLKTVYQYEHLLKAKDIIPDDVRKDLEEAGTRTRILAGLRNNLGWVFATPTQRKQYVEGYQYLSKGLNTGTVRTIKEYDKRLMEAPFLSDSKIWADFMLRPTVYINLLENLVPGVFGNDDQLYGLPEDLAREIQDEAFFPAGLNVTLRHYQIWGVKYILHQEKALLGDEMGLGKTVQAIATMVSLRNTGAKRFLVICPASVLPNWCKEIEKKSKLHAVKIHGYGRQAAFDSWLENGGVAVTTYETLGTLIIPEKMAYDLLVVDEAHFVKNVNAQRSQNVRMFGKFTKRILYMTGTALENKVEEMVSLLKDLNPSVAGQAQRMAFMSTAPQFRQMIAPVYYRRKRVDVLTELPDIQTVPDWCDLFPEEEAVYKQAVRAKNQSMIRKVSWVAPDMNKSAKARRMKEIIDEAESDGRKVLVFSFYLEVIDRVIQMLGNRCTQPINGSVSVERRQQIIDEFETMPAGSVLPAQIQAGGTGLNIQSASVVIICEPQLKPSIENQAISRAYRMGQTRKVLVYRLLAAHTIDERIDDLLARKQAQFDAFADVSVAAAATPKEDPSIDDKTLSKLIQEEIDRINAESDHEDASLKNQKKTVMPPSGAEAAVRRSSTAAPPKPKVSAPPKMNASPLPAKQVQFIVGSNQQRTGNTPQRPATEPASGNQGTNHNTNPGISIGAQKQKKQMLQPSLPAQSRSIEGQQKVEMKRFAQLDDFLMFVSGQGVQIKDNREKGGCIWIQTDPRIDEIVKNQVFDERKFMYSAKSKALGGVPGWYY